MTNPALMAVDDDPDGLRALDGALRRRYGHDYLIITEGSPAAALRRLRQLRDAGQPVAMVMAASGMATTPGAEFLSLVRGIQATSKRVLVVPRGGPAAPSLRVPVPLVRDRQAAAPVLHAIALGMIDFTGPSVNCWRSGLTSSPPPPCPRCGSSGGSGRLARMSCVTRWLATASPTPSTPPSPPMASRGCDGQGRTARRSRSW